MTRTREATPTRRRSLVTWRVAGSLVASLTLAFGTANVVAALAHDTQHLRRLITDPVRFVNVDTSGGSITITGSAAGDDVVVDMTLSRGLETPAHSETVEGDRLVLRSSCLLLVTTFCQVDYGIRVPPDVSVIAHSDGGDVKVSNVRGDLELSSSGGRLVANDVDGEIARFESDGGDIEADGLSARSIEASTNGGRVLLLLDSPPTAVDASSDGGDVEIVLPDTADAYRVELSSDGGGTSAAVRTDPTSYRVITASSNGGDVIVRYPTT